MSTCNTKTEPCQVGTASIAPSIQRILAALEAAYRSPRHGNPADPLDDLIYLKLSQQTNAVKFATVYASLRRRGWEDRKSTRLNSSHYSRSRMPSSA